MICDIVWEEDCYYARGDRGRRGGGAPCQSAVRKGNMPRLP